MKRSGPQQLQQLAEEGTTLPQLVALHVLQFEGPMQMSTLTERLQLSTSAVSHLVQRLFEQGYVVREEDESDRRQRRLSLTPVGVTRVEHLMAARLRELKASVEPLSLKTRTDLAEVLERVLEEIEAAPDVHVCPEKTT